MGVMNVIKDTFVAVVLVKSQYMPTKARADPTIPKYRIARTEVSVKFKAVFLSVSNPSEVNTMLPIRA